MKYLLCLFALLFVSPAFADEISEARVRVALALAVAKVSETVAPPLVIDTTGWHWMIHSDGTAAGLMDAHHKQIGGYRFSDGLYQPLDGETWGKPTKPPIAPPAKPARTACTGGCGPACGCPATVGGGCPCPPSAMVNRPISYELPVSFGQACVGST